MSNNTVFSPSRQAFYDLTLGYTDLPDDLIAIDATQHLSLVGMINEGRIINPDLTYSEPRPSFYHTWNGSDWVDLRDENEKEEDRLANFKPLTRRQFMRTMVLQGYDLDVIEGYLNQIEDKATRQLALIDWKESTEFQRLDGTLIMMSSLLGLTPEQVDAMWEVGLTL